jgi:ornithine cyclodeaminase/alanine dehydrogenase-like protein (mu-crystallin family)
MKSFLSIDHATKEREGWANTKFGMMSPEYGEYDRLIKDQLRAADVIITTVPSTEPLFDHLILTSTEGRKKGRLVIAVGSYKPHMIEVPVEIVEQAVRPSHDHRHFHRHAAEGGVIVVDTLTGCLKEAGEIIQADLNPMQLVEVGELVMLEVQAAPPPLETTLSDLDIDKISQDPSNASSSSMASVFGREDSFNSTSTSTGRSSSLSRALSGSLSRSGSKSDKHRRSSSADSRKGKKKEKDDAMSRWLSQGNVVYKSVGLGLMDLVIGGDLIKLAKEQGLGVTVPNF